MTTVERRFRIEEQRFSWAILNRLPDQVDDPLYIGLRDGLHNPIVDQVSDLLIPLSSHLQDPTQVRNPTHGR